MSTFGEHPGSVGHDYLDELFEHAEKHIPKTHHKDTPLFLLATAGMRLLPEVQQKEVLKQVCSYARKNTKFQLPDCDLHVRIIPGETEGLYGWIAANYLLGGFNKPRVNPEDHHTYGFLDMGGASAQIAFAPNATEADKHAEDLKILRLRAADGSPLEYQVFVTTWLGFGVNEARRRYTEALLDAHGAPKHTTEIPDPCLPQGLEIAQSGGKIYGDASVIKPDSPYLLGTGRFTECLSSTFPLLDKDAPCDDPPCLLHGSHVPAIDFGVNHFVGISEYWHTTHEIFEMGNTDRAYDFQTYQQRVTEFCSRSWSDIETELGAHKYGSKVDATTAAEVCFKASWLINMLHDGIGVPRVGLEASGTTSDSANTTQDLLDAAKDNDYLAPFQAVNKIDSTEVSWTLGKMVLYASSQIPPAAADAMPVGFGSNTRSGRLPADWQQPAVNIASFDPSSSRPLTADEGTLEPELSSDVDTDLDTDIEDDSLTSILSSSNLPRRGPGFALFLVLLIVVGLLLCGRDRRRNLFRKLTGRGSSSPSLPTLESAPPRTRKGGLASHLPFFLRSATATDKPQRYDRVPVDGGLASPHDFELASLESDSDSSGSSSSARRPHGTRTRSVQALNSGAYSPRGAGAMTPRGTLSPRLSRPSAGGGVGLSGAGYFDRSPMGSALNLGSLGGLASRSGSPKRGKESVD